MVVNTMWKVPGPSSRCELYYYDLIKSNDSKICGCPFGCCPAYKKFRNGNKYNACPYYIRGRDAMAKRIAEMMPLIEINKQA